MPALAKAKHEIFCQGIAAGMRPDEAYVKAGYVDGHSNAYHLLKKPHIQRRVQELIERMAKGLDITRPRIMSELAKIAFFNPAAVLEIDESGRASLDLSSLDVDMASALDIVVVVDDNGKSETKVKLADTATRKAALELLGKNLGMWVERTEHGQAGDFTAVQSTEQLVAKLREELGEREANEFAAMMAGKSDRTTLN